MPKVARTLWSGISAGGALLSGFQRPQSIVHQSSLNGHPVLIVCLGGCYFGDTVLPNLAWRAERESDSADGFYRFFYSHFTSTFQDHTLSFSASLGAMLRLIISCSKSLNA